MNSKIKSLITGGAGFIGSHLSEALLSKGYEVYCLDNLATGNAKNIQHLVPHEDFHFIETDVVNDFSPALKKELRGTRFVYHFASPASPPQYRRLAIETLLVNSQGTYHALELARQEKARFLVASTSEVYGDPRQHPQKESYFGNVNSVGLRACYDEAKRFSEALSIEYFRKYHLDARIIRIFNTYGPKMEKNDGRVISNFVTQALSGRDLTVYGDGNQTRSFCFVSDMIKGIVSFMETEGLDGEVINVGNTNEQTVNDIAKLVLSLTGAKGKIVYNHSDRIGEDPQRRKPDITKAKKLLSFKPSVSIEEGLQKTIEYFKTV